MKVAIVRVGRQQLGTPCPAFLLHSASAHFTRYYLSAKAENDIVLLLSGRHGIITADRVLAPYVERLDPYDPDLQERVRGALAGLPARFYGNADTMRLFKGLAVTWMAPEKAGRRLEARGAFRSIQGKAAPRRRIVEWLHANSGATIEDARKWARYTWRHQPTADVQVWRLLASEFCRREGDRLHYAWSVE